ncbi:hypothetical protein D3C85_1067930 [compost metagenome]
MLFQPHNIIVMHLTDRSFILKPCLDAIVIELKSTHKQACHLLARKESIRLIHPLIALHDVQLFQRIYCFRVGACFRYVCKSIQRFRLFQVKCFTEPYGSNASRNSIIRMEVAVRLGLDYTSLLQ